MLPTLRPGDRVTLFPVEPQGIRQQDVVAYRSHGGELVLHRVHAVWTDRLITAGDNLPLFDPPVWKTDVVGVARDVARRSAPSPWPAHPQPTTAGIWLIGADADLSTSDTCVVPAAWRVRRRPAEGVGVSAPVLEEIQTAVAGRPCIGVSEHAVYGARQLLSGGLPPHTQVIIGSSFGKLHGPLPGHLIPSGTADVHVRLGPPEVRLSATETLRRLAALVAPGAVS
jgi:hypothetical protein